MSKFRLLFVMGIALFIGGQSLFAQKANKKEEKKALVRELIDSGRYKIEVNRALPMGGRSVNLTSLYTLEISNDSVISYLPYFGRAYSVPYGGGDGLRFEGLINDYSLSYNKKDKAQINFNTKSSEDNYTFNVQIFSNGSATINVNSVNRQSITYRGELILDENRK